MPSSSSFCAMTSLASTEKETASPWVPSRRVVSKVWIRIMLHQIKLKPTQAGMPVLRDSGFLSFFQERHHLAQLGADFFNLGFLGAFAHCQEFVTSALVLVNPLFSELAGLNLRQDLFHLVARLLVDDARSARIIAVLRRVRNRIAHIAEAALVNKIDNQLQFV